MLLIATHNLHKFSEIEQILAPIPCQSGKALSLPSPEETGLTFIENALIKARSAAKHANSPCLADDSGLVVPALHGAPGIYSARYAGIHQSDAAHRALLLENMRHLSGASRKAYFYCVMVYIQYEEDPSPIIGIGKWEGEISLQEQGENGFGYDPIFYLPSYQKTAAELPCSLKNSISHRGQALKTIAQELKSVMLI
jgi:XTP/dITP diphosphohydrolase